MEKIMSRVGSAARGFGEVAGVVATIAGCYCAVVGAFNLCVAMPVIAGVNGLERVIGERTTLSGTLLNRDLVHLPISDGDLFVGKLLLDDGRTVDVNDQCDIIAGKFMPNIELSNMRVWGHYNVDALGSQTMGYKVLDFSESPFPKSK